MPGVPSIALLVVVFVLIDAIIVGALAASLGMLWKDMGRGYSAVPLAPGGVRKDFQSLKVDLFNLGLAVHLGVDETHLHFYPSAFLRAVKARAFSVPWERVEHVKTYRGGKVVKVRINKHSVVGPGWAFGMATPRA